MPRRGENIYKRKDGRWEGRILKQDGKYQYLYAKSYREVKEKMKMFKDDGKSAKQKSFCLLKEASSQFGEWLEGGIISNVKPSTYDNYHCCINNYVIPFFNRRENRTISVESVSGFVKYIAENTVLSSSYKKKILTIFKTSVKEILKSSPNKAEILECIKIPRSTYREVQVFSISEQRKIEGAVLNSEDRRNLGIVLCFYTGIRLGELCGLRWEDFDIEAGTMTVKRTVSRTKSFQKYGKKTTLYIGTPKSKKSIRKIPLPAFLLNKAKAFKLAHENENCYILSQDIVPIDPRTYQSFFKKVLYEAGVKDRKFHAIRHTFATRALELGVDIKTLSEILGHSNVSVTLNVYAHSLMEQKKIAIEKFNDLHITYMGQQLTPSILPSR